MAVKPVFPQMSELVFRAIAAGPLQLRSVHKLAVVVFVRARRSVHIAQAEVSGTETTWLSDKTQQYPKGLYTRRPPRSPSAGFWTVSD